MPATHNKHTFALALISTHPEANEAVIVKMLLEGKSQGLHSGTEFTEDQARAYYRGCCRELGWEPKGVQKKARGSAAIEVPKVSREEAAAALSAAQFVAKLGEEEIA